MKKSLSLLLAIAMVFSMFASVAVAEETTTVQLDAAAKFEALKELGIFVGDANTGDSALDREMTRAEAAVIVANLFELDTSNPPANPTFTDVGPEGSDNEHWAYASIEAAAAAGIINGRTNGEFDPGTEAEVAAGVGHVTLQELAVMLTLGLEYSTDLTIDHNATISGAAPWAQAYVAAAVSWGIIPSQSDYTHKALREELVNAAYEVKVTVDAEGLSVEAVEVVDENNLDVTFSDGETVRVELAEALEVNVPQTVTFTYQGKTFTETVTLEASEDVIAINEAKAFSEKVLEVTLNIEVNNPQASDFSIVTLDGVETEDDTVIEIEDVQLAPFSNDKVFITTEGFEPGALYEVVAANGTKDYFVGINRDKGDLKPAFTAWAASHNEVEVEWFEPVYIDENATFTVKHYNSDRAVEIHEVEVTSEKVILTVDDMSSANLYEVTMDGDYTNVHGNKGEVKSYVFQGRDIDDTKYEVVAAELRTPNILRVQVARTNIADWDEILNPDNYVVESYFGGQPIEITEVEEVRRDRYQVALHLAEDIGEGDLYRLTLQNMKTRNGFGVADEPLNSTVFYGLPESNEKLAINYDEILYFFNPTSFNVQFTAIVNPEQIANQANYKLVNLSKNEEVDFRIRVRSNSPITHDKGEVFFDLNEPLNENDVYQITVSNLTDLYGNELDKDRSTIVFDLSDARNQKAVDDPIEEITNVVYSFNGTHHEIRVEFDQAPDSNSANDVRKYYIEGLGYPYEIPNNGVSGRNVTLRIVEPVKGELYKVRASNIHNRHNVAMKEDKVEFTFAASEGTSETGVQPNFEMARSVDNRTVALHFDTNVKAAPFKGTFYNESNQLIADVFSYERGKESSGIYLNDAPYLAVVFFDVNDDNVIYLRASEEAFTSGHRFIKIEESNFLHEDSAEEQAFAGVSIDPLAPNMLRVIAIDNKTVTVTYNSPVEAPKAEDYWIEKDDESINFSKVVKVSDLVYQFAIEEGKELSTGIYTLNVDERDLKDATGYIHANAGENTDIVTREFAGRSNDPSDLPSPTLVALDKYTFEVRYNEAMGSNVTDSTYYELLVDDSVKVTGDDLTITYDEATSVATVHSTKDLSNQGDRILTLKISQDVTNELGTRSIAEKYSGTLVTRTNNPADPVMSYKSATVNDAGDYVIEVEFNRPVAFDLGFAIPSENSIDGKFNLDLVKDRITGGSRKPLTADLSADGLTLTITGNNGGMDDYKYYAVILEGIEDNKMYHLYSGHEITKKLTLEGTLVFDRD